MLKLGELGEVITSLGENAKDLKVIVPVFSPGSMGGTKGVAITDIDIGFDHDHGKAILRLDGEVSKLTDKQKSAIMQSVRRGSSWHAYQQYKAMKEREQAERSRLHTLLASARVSVQDSLSRCAADELQGDECKRLQDLLLEIDKELAPKRRGQAVAGAGE